MSEKLQNLSRDDTIYRNQCSHVGHHYEIISKLRDSYRFCTKCGELTYIKPLNEINLDARKETASSVAQSD